MKRQKQSCLKQTIPASTREIPTAVRQTPATPAPRLNALPHTSPTLTTLSTTIFMDAQSPTTGSQPNQKLRLGSKTQGSSPRSTSDVHCHSGWSIRRLLSRRESRKYSVLEREPNRLRKRMGN